MEIQKVLSEAQINQVTGGGKEERDLAVKQLAGSGVSWEDFISIVNAVNVCVRSGKRYIPEITVNPAVSQDWCQEFIEDGRRPCLCWTSPEYKDLNTCRFNGKFGLSPMNVVYILNKTRDKDHIGQELTESEKETLIRKYVTLTNKDIETAIRNGAIE